MKVINHFYNFLILIIVVIIFSASNIYAQSDKYKVKNSFTLAKNINKVGDYYQLYFKNLNVIPYYYDQDKLDLLKKLENKKKIPEAIKVLEEYVENFGIKNFQKETYMLWRLGIWYDQHNQQEKAKCYFRLVLRHHRGSLTKVQNYYDSLTEKSKQNWVPLKQYYEMVEYRKAIDTIKPPQGVLTNMGVEINDRAEDYGPALSRSTNLLIFTSKRNKNGYFEENRFNEDLFYSIGEEGYYAQSEVMKGVNSQYNEGSPCLSKNGLKLYFARCNSPDGFGNCDIYTASRKDTLSEWENVRNIGSQVNSSSWDSQPALSGTEDTLYFASDRMGGFGLSDIYFCYKTKSGSWSDPTNLGPIINTRNNEVSPFYNPKYNVLYFSSNFGLINFGDFDIYKSRKIGKYFEEPKSIGPLVNGAGSEYYFTIDANSKNLYYARSEENDIKNLDLFSFPLPMEAQPNSYTKLEGQLLDSISKKPLSGIISVIDLDNSVEVAPKFLNLDGSFQFDLINNNRYRIIIRGDEFFSVEKDINLKADTVIRLVTSIIDNEKPLILDKIEFENGKSDILPSMDLSLNVVIKYLLDNPNVNMEIDGHTDSDGDKALNKSLSKARAESIKKYVCEKGSIDPKRIFAEGFGDTRPLTQGNTSEDKKLNRRVEFIVIKK